MKNIDNKLTTSSKEHLSLAERHKLPHRVIWFTTCRTGVWGLLGGSSTFFWKTLWEADDWATRGGLEKINWSKSPFYAYYKDFDIEGCAIPDQQIVRITHSICGRDLLTNNSALWKQGNTVGFE
ncbi:hypothetical protein RND71_011676 [Anisodus tanguticus]|uniref:Uncharacterized protein n=1 Tax=Anisodus tanguticus TaxID=243964 RepID=A0AAE1VP22_9SOLA|nr:hypothetical protein RND71_011676 [Anisodus tanguticus]